MNQPSPAPSRSPPPVTEHPAGPGIMLAALGVVFGDIGTSPLYAFKESLHSAGHGGDPALGIASLIFWAVLLVVGIKYVLLVMSADNHGEGGTISLLSLALPAAPERWRGTVLMVGLAGASLFFGDAMITPTISVLSAVEGLHVVTPALTPYVVPLACVVLALLFLVQRRGSAAIGRFFGPVMLAWFAVLAIAGLVHALRHPQVFAALSPTYAWDYLIHAPGTGAFLVLGSAFLALTGGEALYADMGHFGRRAIRLDWFLLVLPALVLNYLGQAAVVITDPSAAANPFFGLFPSWLLIPVVLLATASTVIASQAVISGAFTLVQQAIQMGHVPRLEVRQTSKDAAGQVYLPQVNWILAAAVLGLVLGFGSSTALANAYGIAVAGDMLATTLLLSVVALGQWRQPPALVLAVGAPFLLLDLVFVTSNLHKVPDGGWFPLLVGAACLTMSLLWRKGKAVLASRRDEDAQELDAFIGRLSGPDAPPRTRGVAIYLSGQRTTVPTALALNLRHNGVLHERVWLLRVEAERQPRVPEAERLSVEDLGCGVVRATLRFGFAEDPNVPAALRVHGAAFGLDPQAASFFVGRDVPVASMRPDLSAWQEGVFSYLARNAMRSSDYFRVPPNRVVELGSRVEV
ncbi:potassium transporter Kup [Roseomonas nepalensis]|uniref:Probable potassium transport system protein Kup n=2 Tax=Muricoccus nepalensis TaxID=1854500 RepID=A0A502FSK7_9PROT|nr:potassium transporter Kup [Roseomonas nepalensis]